MPVRFTALSLIALLALVTATGCAGGDESGGLQVERRESQERRSSEDVLAEATARAAQLEPSPSASPTVLADGSPAVPSPLPTAEAAATPRQDPVQTATAPPVPTGDEYDSTANMYLYLSGAGHSGEMTVQALAASVENADRSMVPVIIEGMRFLGSTSLADFSTVALSELTGVNPGQGIAAWGEWMEWYGGSAADYPPPEGYVDWKAHVHSQIDPAFGRFLSPWALTGRIDPTEIVWGGVRKDGIPDLRNAPLMSPDEAESAYLLPEDRVFGVSLNGEHRAYPLRIVNAHEMANDVLGGEPISLAY